MLSVLPSQLERTTTLEQQYFLQLQLAEQARGVMALFQNFLQLATTQTIKGVQEQYLLPLQELVEQMQPTDSVYSLLWDLLGHTKNHESNDKSDLLVTLRALLVHFVSFLQTNPELVTNHNQHYSPSLSAVEKFYLQLILSAELKSEVSIRSFALFMLENKDDFLINYRENYTKILANTSRFTKSTMHLSDYYSQMVKYMRSNGSLDEELQVFNGIILRFLNHTNPQ